MIAHFSKEQTADANIVAPLAKKGKTGVADEPPVTSKSPPAPTPPVLGMSEDNSDPNLGLRLVLLTFCADVLNKFEATASGLTQQISEARACIHRLECQNNALVTDSSEIIVQDHKIQHQAGSSDCVNEVPSS